MPKLGIRHNPRPKDVTDFQPKNYYPTAENKERRPIRTSRNPFVSLHTDLLKLGIRRGDLDFGSAPDSIAMRGRAVLSTAIGLAGGGTVAKV